MRRYDVGDRVRVFVNFFNLSGVAAEPTGVAAAFKDPSLNTTVVDPGNIIHDLSNDPATGQPYVGRYYIDITFDEGSETVPWWVRFEGTGSVVNASEAALWVKPPQVVIP